jgi:hypothetical protein
MRPGWDDAGHAVLLSIKCAAGNYLWRSASFPGRHAATFQNRGIRAFQFEMPPGVENEKLGIFPESRIGMINAVIFGL